MMIIIQFVSIAFVFLITYLIFQSFGVPQKNLLYTREEKNEWDNLISGKFGSLATISNIAGTLTSLATVYIFFIGNTKLFGFFITASLLSLGVGVFISNYFTKKISNNKDFQLRMDSPDQGGAVIASAFWDKDKRVITANKIIRYVSLVNIGCIIWLELAVFSDISSLFASNGNIYVGTAVLFVVAFFLLHFTLAYGLRGFVFADLFQSPLILLGLLALLCGAVWLISSSPVESTGYFPKIINPMLGVFEYVAFVVATFFMNAFLVLISESHWMRYWIFKNKEISCQHHGVVVTSFVWMVLIVIGLLSNLFTREVGDVGVVEFISRIFNKSLFFCAAFWVSAMAALFSTADAQIYSFLLVKEYNPNTGMLRTELFRSVNPVRTSFFVAIILSIIYFLMRVNSLPFEKLIFLLFPISTNIAPVFVYLIKGIKINPVPIVFSIILYFLASIAGLVQEQNNFFWTVSAPLMPFIVSIFLYLYLSLSSKSNKGIE